MAQRQNEGASEPTDGAGAGNAGDSVREIRKYSNRRYYDSQQSRHVTLEDIRDLVRSGEAVRIIDNQSGEEITSRVLAQIILDHEPAKLAAFPVELMHHLIQTNERIVEEFIETYFAGALRAYLESQRQMEQYLRRSMGLTPGVNLPGATGMPGGWPPFFTNPFGAFGSSGAPNSPTSEASNDRNAALRAEIQELREQIRDLRQARKEAGESD